MLTTELADVSTLVALSLRDHQHHRVAAKWFDTTDAFALTPITEMGLIKLLRNPTVTLTNDPIPMADIEAILVDLHADRRCEFWSDGLSMTTLYPLPVRLAPRHVTDLHLVALARSRNAKFVTLDAKLIGALPPGSLRTTVVSLV